MPESPLVEFYLGRGGAGSAGYSLQEIQNDWSDQQLELVHNYIQWLFPLTEFSAFNPSAPVLDSETIARFRSELYHSTKLILLFGAYVGILWL